MLAKSRVSVILKCKTDPRKQSKRVLLMAPTTPTSEHDEVHAAMERPKHSSLCIDTSLSSIYHLPRVSHQKLNICLIYRLNGPPFVAMPTQVNAIVFSHTQMDYLTLFRIQHHTYARIRRHSPGSGSFYATTTNTTGPLAR